MALSSLSSCQVSLLGRDDWSFRRGRTFGTRLVTFASHAVLDLLPNRNAASAATWMREHPEIEVGSRDRGGEYASAVVAGAPQALQCADRFHILKNLGEALEGLLARHRATKRQKNIQETREEHIPREHASRSARRSPKVERFQQASREERLARSEQVVALRTLGMSQAALAKRVGIDESTVGNWLAAGASPETTRGPSVSRLDPSLPSLFQQWESGCHTMVRLHQELVARGDKGPYASVRDHLVRQLPEGKKNAAKGNALSPAPLSSRRAPFLFLRRPEKVTPDEQAPLLTLRQTHPEVERTSDLVQQCAQMVRTRTGEHLDGWLAEGAESQIPERQSFPSALSERNPLLLQVYLCLTAMASSRERSTCESFSNVWDMAEQDSHSCVNECCTRSRASRPLIFRTA